MPSSVASVLLLVNLFLRRVCACKLAIVVLDLDRSRALRGRMRALRMRVKSRGRVLRMRGEFLLFLLSFFWWYRTSRSFSQHILTSDFRAFADYIFGSLILHFFCVNFINWAVLGARSLCSIPCWLILFSVWGWFILIFRWSGECCLLDILTPGNFLADLCFSLVRFVYDRGEKCCSYLTYLLSQDWLVGQVYVIQMTLCQRPPGVEQTIRKWSWMKTQWRVSIEQDPS